MAFGSLNKNNSNFEIAKWQFATVKYGLKAQSIKKPCLADSQPAQDLDCGGLNLSTGHCFPKPGDPISMEYYLRL